MPRDFSRTLRVAGLIQRELAAIIPLEAKDPRIGMVTLTEVEVSPDYAHAHVFFTVIGDAARIGDAVVGLNQAAGYLRRELSQRLVLRAIPQLHFVYDESVERGVRLSRLIDAAMTAPKKARKRR
jgi:ribosome-binding factor A